MRTKQMPVFTCALQLLVAVSVSKGEGEKKMADKQAEIKKLQKERLKILVTIAHEHTVLLRDVRWDFGKAGEAHRKVLVAIVQIADTPEERVTALRDLEKLAKNLVKLAEDRLKMGAGRLVDHFEMQALVLEVQIELLKEEATIKPKKE